MDKAKINSKIEYALQGISISKYQKAALIQLFTDIVQLAIEGSLKPELIQATSDKLGCIKIGYNNNGKNYAVLLDSTGKAYVNVPWTDNNTTYNVASSLANGLMSKEDKAKLDNIANNANNYSLPNATTSSIGGVKQAATVEALEEADEIATVISTVNTLISNLKAAGVVANS